MLRGGGLGHVHVHVFTANSSVEYRDETDTWHVTAVSRRSNFGCASDQNDNAGVFARSSPQLTPIAIVAVMLLVVCVMSASVAVLIRIVVMTLVFVDFAL